MTGDTANQFVSGSKKQWEALVCTVWEMDRRTRTESGKALAAAAGLGKSTLLRKIEAVHLAKQSGMAYAQVVDMGQRACMAKFVTDKRNGRQDEQCVLKWMVAPEIRDAANQNAWRVSKVLGFTTSNQFWQFLNAQLELATDEELQHSAGMLNAQK
jgi:hypothetical protein